MRYNLTEHAVVRYRQRVRRRGGLKVARRELRERCEGAEVVADAPLWVAGDAPPADYYLMLDSDTAALVRGRSVVTVVTRAWADWLVRRRCAELGWVKAA